MQVSRSKKWESKPALDEDGTPLLSKTGKKILKPSYSILQDQFFNFMRSAGYTDVERGQRGSTEEHSTITQFKVQAEQDRLAGLEATRAAIEAEVERIEEEQKSAQKQAQQVMERIKELAPAVNNMERLAKEFADDPENALPDAGTLESAKSYREKKAKPFFSRIVSLLRSVYRSYIELKGKYDRLLQSYNRECYKSSQMGDQIDALSEENKRLLGITAEFDRVKRILGQDKLEAAMDAAKQEKANMQSAKKKKQQYIR